MRFPTPCHFAAFPEKVLQFVLILAQTTVLATASKAEPSEPKPQPVVNAIADAETPKDVVAHEVGRLQQLRKKTADIASHLCETLPHASARDAASAKTVTIRDPLCKGVPFAREGFRVLTQVSRENRYPIVVKDIYDNTTITTFNTQAVATGQYSTHEACEMSPSGALAAIVYERHVGVFSTDKEEPLYVFEWERGHTSTRPLFCSDESLIVSYSGEGCLTVRCSYTGEVRNILKPPRPNVSVEAIGAATSLPFVAALYDRYGVVLWRVDSGEKVAFLPIAEKDYGYFGLAISSKGDVVATASLERLHVWRTADAHELTNLTFDREQRIRALALRSDGSEAIVGLEDGIVCSVDVQSGTLRGVWRLGKTRFYDPLHRLEWLDNESLLVACFDNAVEWYGGEDLTPNKATIGHPNPLSPIGGMTGRKPRAWSVGVENKCLVALADTDRKGVTRVCLPVAAIVEPHKLARVNSQPAEIDALDLGKVVAESGCDLRDYVQYGDRTLADKAAKGDRFDREDAEEKASEHRKSLEKQAFYYTLDYEWDKSIEQEDHIVVAARVPFFCNIKADGTVASRECLQQAWALLPNGDLRLCVTNSDLMANRGRLYLPEDITGPTLVVRVSGARDVLRAIAKKDGDCKMTIVGEGIRCVKRTKRGFYRAEAVGLSGDCSSVRMARGKAGGDSLRDYLEVETGGPASVAIEADVKRIEIAKLDEASRRVLMSWPAAESK